MIQIQNNSLLVIGNWLLVIGWAGWHEIVCLLAPKGLTNMGGILTDFQTKVNKKDE